MVYQLERIAASKTKDKSHDSLQLISKSLYWLQPLLINSDCISGRNFLLQLSLLIQNNIVILVPLYPQKNRLSPPGGNFTPNLGTTDVMHGNCLNGDNITEQAETFNVIKNGVRNSQIFYQSR